MIEVYPNSVFDIEGVIKNNSSDRAWPKGTKLVQIFGSELKTTTKEFEEVAPGESRPFKITAQAPS